LGACEPYSLELCEWLLKRIPFCEKLRFVSSGTEAVMSAIRVARAATGRNLILKFDGCYHGHSDGMLVKSGSGLAGLASSDSAGVSATAASETLVSPLDNDELLEKVFADHGSSIAGVIVEPLPANYGLLIQRKEFLQKIQDLCRKHGSLFILDEVISGFRTGMTGMAGAWGLDPDLLCYGKIMGGGFNVAAYGGKTKWMSLVAPSGPVYQAGTLSANPVAMIAGLGTLKKMERLDVWAELRSKAKTLAHHFNEGAKKKNLAFQLVQFESMFWLTPKTDHPIRSLGDIPSNQGEFYKKFFHSMLGQSVYLAPSGYEVNFLSMAHTDSHLEATANAICIGLEAAAKE
jgi:glutamate-1-semialdehyde 2,1-aminomutase